MLASSNGHAALPATIAEVEVVGPSVILTLRRDANNAPIEAHLTRQQYAALGLRAGDAVSVRLTNVKTFPVIDRGSAL